MMAPKVFQKQRAHMEFIGKVKACYVRGELVYDGTGIVGKAGWGTYIPKKRG